MRRISRLDRSIDLLRKRATPNPQYLCSACHHQASSFSTSTLRATRTNKKVPFTEKVRQRIWGTDQPPGQEDPYGDASVFDQTKKRLQREEEQQKEDELTVSSGVKPDLSNYEPAHTADGLEHIGGWGGWWKENWDPKNRFQGFLPAERVTDDDDIARALHRALVEVFALKQAGKSLSEISSAQPGMDETMEVRVTPTESGARLDFMGSASLERIVQSLAPADETFTKENPTESEEDIDADRSTVDPLEEGSLEAPFDETATKENPTESEEDVAADRSEVDPLPAHHDPAWRDVSLEEPEVKFAVLKRIMQLTAIHVPDHALQSAKTANQLLAHLITPPKARKLVEVIAQNEQLMTTPNVSIFAKRITPKDKEVMIGRWKVIEEELVKRGLPLPSGRPTRKGVESM